MRHQIPDPFIARPAGHSIHNIRHPSYLGHPPRGSSRPSSPDAEVDSSCQPISHGIPDDRLVAVSAHDPYEPERAIADIEQVAIQASCETRRLVGQNAQAFSAAALPLCRTIRLTAPPRIVRPATAPGLSSAGMMAGTSPRSARTLKVSACAPGVGALGLSVRRSPQHRRVLDLPVEDAKSTSSAPASADASPRDPEAHGRRRARLPAARPTAHHAVR